MGMILGSLRDEDDYPWKDDEPIGGTAALRAERREKWEWAKRIEAEGGDARGDDDLADMIKIIRDRKL